MASSMDPSRVKSCPECLCIPCKHDISLEQVEDGLRRTCLQDEAKQVEPKTDEVCDICHHRKAVKAHPDLYNKQTVHVQVDKDPPLRGMTCSEHQKQLEVYCRTDHKCVCCLCMLDDHKAHDTVSAASGRTEIEGELKMSKQTISEREAQLKKLKSAKSVLRDLAQATEEECVRLVDELIDSMKNRRSEIKVLIKTQEKAELDRVEDLLTSLEQELEDLNNCHARMDQLSHIQDHIHYLQSVQSLGFSSTDVPNIVINPHFSFGELVKSISVVKGRLEDLWQQELPRMSLAVKSDKILVPLEPETREDFLQYFIPLSLDPNTAHWSLKLFHQNQAVACNPEPQPHPDHHDRFDWWAQLLCHEALMGRCYWEVQWTGLYGADIAVSYRDICRKGEGDECGFGYNKNCWSLGCSIFKYVFEHNNEERAVAVPTSHRIGVYLDHRAGVISFYSVSENMTLLHRTETKFTQPLYAGFGLYQGSTVQICQLDQEMKTTKKITKNVKVQRCEKVRSRSKKIINRKK